jgi:hypothetical protein
MTDSDKVHCESIRRPPGECRLNKQSNEDMSLSHAAQLSGPASHVETLIRPGMFAAFAEFERRLMLERQRAGISKPELGASPCSRMLVEQGKSEQAGLCVTVRRSASEKVCFQVLSLRQPVSVSLSKT